MWKTKKVLCITFLSVLSLFLFLPSVGICSESRTYQLTESELTTLETNLETLEMHNETLKNILMEQGDELTAALNALMESQKELTTLRTELKACKTEIELSQKSLAIANEELQKASESFKQYEKERDRTENRLRNQRNIWEVLCFVAVGVAVAR